LSISSHARSSSPWSSAWTTLLDPDELALVVAEDRSQGIVDVEKLARGREHCHPRRCLLEACPVSLGAGWPCVGLGRQPPASHQEQHQHQGQTEVDRSPPDRIGRGRRSGEGIAGDDEAGNEVKRRHVEEGEDEKQPVVVEGDGDDRQEECELGLRRPFHVGDQRPRGDDQPDGDGAGGEIAAPG
jgi:hypothetical protein